MNTPLAILFLIVFAFVLLANAQLSELRQKFLDAQKFAIAAGLTLIVAAIWVLVALSRLIAALFQ